jgi:hypothetical protein
MTLLFLVALVLLVWDRRHAHSSQEALLNHCQQMLDQQSLRHSKAEKNWMDERTLLLNRIKPETASRSCRDPCRPPPRLCIRTLTRTTGRARTRSLSASADEEMAQ